MCVAIRNKAQVCNKMHKGSKWVSEADHNEEETVIRKEKLNEG